MQNFRDNYVSGALARRRSSLGRKRSSGSLITDTISSGDQKASSEKNTYRDVRVQIELKEIGSFMDDHEDGVTTASKELCQKLLNSPQELPIDTLFSDDLFPGVCKMVKGQNEATVVRYILPQLVPSAKIRALRGSKHLRILNETIDASWINAIKCCGRRPQPDYGLGVRREAFSREQLRKLQPFIGTQMDEESMFAATYDTCFPFLTTEVTCGATALDIADRQNALSQTIALRGLVTLFRLVGREQELHREIVGFSFSHDDEAVRIFGHYPYIDGKDTTYHRTPIAKFDFSPTAEGDKRWKTPTFVMNLQDLWASDHFELICSAVDMLPPDLNFEVTPQPEIEMYHRSEASEQSPQPSGLSQQLEDSIITDEEHVQTQGDHPITPDTSTHTAGRKKKRIAKLSKT